MVFYLFPGLRKSLQPETLDGDRENWLPSCILNNFHTLQLTVSETQHEARTHGGSASPLELSRARSVCVMYTFNTFPSLVSQVARDQPCAEVWKTSWISHPLDFFSPLWDKPNNLFSHIKCALCSHLQASCKSLWLVYTPVYFSCRALSPLFAITPFKELLLWKLPRVYADCFPQST